MKTVVVDAFGGDHAPQAIVEGCARALSEIADLRLILTGDENRLKEEAARCRLDSARTELCHAPEIITNNEHPVQAVRSKKQSSVVKAMELVAHKEASVMISAGSTGAVLAGGTFIVKRIRGIRRPALAPVLPTLAGHGVVLVDCGANVDCKPQFLQQFAVMGSVYAERILSLKNPRVGLLNNGAEAEKGCDLTKQAYALLKTQTPVNFAGNCEGRDILSGDFDVVVCDGFAGNVALKSVEGMAAMLMKLLKRELMSSARTKLGALLAKPAFANLKSAMDYHSYGGAIMLGLEGGVIKAHGSSDPASICAAIHQACAFIDGDVVEIIRNNVQAIAADAE